MTLAALWLQLALTVPTAFAVDVEVKALFGGAALLIVEGEQKLVRASDPPFNGVKLVSADTRQAVIEVDGERHTLSLSDRISSRFSKAEKAQVQILMNDRRQYIAHGSVNGRAVRFLVDTGANVVTMNSPTARSLGISLADGRQTRVSTASGIATATIVSVQQMQVGEIVQNNVQTVVVDGNFPTEILLGMSFLRNVEMQESGGMMVLTSKL